MTSQPPGMPWQDSWYGLATQWVPRSRKPLSGRLDHQAMLRRFQDLAAHKHAGRLDLSLLVFSLAEKVSRPGAKFFLADEFGSGIAIAVAEHLFLQEHLTGAIGLEDFVRAVLFAEVLREKGGEAAVSKVVSEEAVSARGAMIAKIVRWVVIRNGTVRLVADLYSHDSIASCTAKRIDAPPGETYGVVALTHQYLAVEAP